MRVGVGHFFAILGVIFSGCVGETFRAAESDDGAAGESNAAGQPSTDDPSEGGAPGEGGAPSAGTASGGSAGAGGSSAGVGGSAGAGAEGGEAGASAEPGYTESHLLDDMEDGDSSLLETNGDWYVLRDTSVGVITPPYGVPFTMTPLMPARGTSKWAAQAQVAGFQGWGAAIGFDFVYLNQERQAYDLEDFRAVRFWARASKAVQLKLQMPNVDTDPFGGRCSGTEGENACHAHFTKAFTVDAEWREVTIPLSELRQEGAGRRAESFDQHRVFSVFFVIGPKQELSVSIDDVALVK